MANTYSQVYIQVVFSVKYRQSLINESARVDIQKYICGIIKHHECKPISIYCNPDHTHILIGLKPNISISDLVKEIKSKSTKYINENRIIPCRFRWQNGYGVFSYSHSQVSRVAQYIENQAEHHNRKNFREEYIRMLEKSQIEYNPQFLFNSLE
ncbi:MAG: IS200/IS605 family transposase [Bacteroidales bacterium]